MRFADGAVRAAYNVQVAAAPGAGVIVAVMTTDRRNDAGLALPMVEAIAGRYGRAPNQLLVDTVYATCADIAALARREGDPVTVYAPPPPERDDIKPESLSSRAYKRSREPEPVRAWRERMASEEGQSVFKRRRLIEQVHAQTKQRGFGQIGVRGLIKAQAVALWHALAHNLLAAHRLRLAAA